MKFHSKPQSATTKQQFFNQSFYVQKLNQQKMNKIQDPNSYVSFQYVKRYFQATKINQLINKSVRTTLQSAYLPENPYNMIGRLLLHDCIYQNIRAYYILLSADKSKRQIQQNNLKNSVDQKNIMKDVKIGNKYYSIPWKLANLVRFDRVDTLWPLLFQQKSEKMDKKRSKKQKSVDISFCLGGSLILKVGNSYSARETIAYTLFYTALVSQTNDHIKKFAEFVIDDCIHICQSPNNVFIKLYVWTYQPISTQWSAQNLIHNRIKIVKQIQKVCFGSSNQLKVEYLMKLPRQSVKTVGTSYLRINKTFVLIEQDGKSTKIHSKNAVKILLTSIFSQESLYLQSVLRAFQMNGSSQQLTHQFNSELHAQIINALQEQEPVWIGWSLYFSNLYIQQQNKNKQKQLKTSISFMMDSPLGFIDLLRHQMNVTKLLSGKSSSATYQAQIVQLLQKSEKRVKMHIQKQQHIYPQTLLFFQAVNRNIQLILQQQVKKKQNIKPILQRIQLLFKYLLNSFYQICFVLKGHLLNQIVNLDNQFGKDGSGQIISNTVTYDIFLRKYKDLPDRTLKIVQEVARYRPSLNRPDSDIRQMILAKYVETYGLYEKIYEFYWKIICGKKLSYPMGQFVTMLRNQAIRFQSKTYPKKNIKFDIEQKKTDGIMIYQKSADSRGQHLFYSLCAEALEDQNIHSYRTIKQIFEQYFQNNIISQKSTKSLPNLQRNSYIISISTQIGRMKSEQSDFNSCKIYVDSVYHVPINPSEIYKLMYDEIVQKLDILDKNQFGVIGIYNGDRELMDEDEVYPWTQNQQRYDVNFLRYTPKKPMNVQSVAKLLKLCKANNTEILIRGVFWLNGLLKSCQISLNFLINKEWHLNHTYTYQRRVFSKHEDIARWGNYNGLKQYIATRKKIEENQKINKRESLKQRYLSNHIDLIQFVAEDMETPLQINKVRTYSPFYSQLEQSLSLVEGLFYLLEYVKTDRNGKFQVKDLKDTVEMLEYYLFDKCLRMDRFIYSQGLSVSIINMVSRIHRYIAQHPDNNGEQKQLISLQKVMIKLMNCIHYVLTSCAFGVIEAIQNEFIKDDDSDDD